MDVLHLVAALWLTAQQVDLAMEPWAQLGAIGILLGLLTTAVIVLFKRQEKAHREIVAAVTQERDRSVARATKSEDDLERLNTLIRERYLIGLVEATATVKETLQLLRGQAR